MAPENEKDLEPGSASVEVEGDAGEAVSRKTSDGDEAGSEVKAAANGESKTAKRGRRSQKVGIVSSDKMQSTVVVRVDRLVRHQKYRRYVWRTSKFMAHDDQGATIGDKVRIVETRPLSARKRWRVVEIVQKAAK